MNLRSELLKILPAERIRDRYIDRVSFASDAGFYYLLPEAIVQPVNEAEIVSLFRLSRTCKVPLVFRGGGTSLSGQSITDGLLVDLSQHWNKATPEQNGDVVRCQPGITGAMVNAHLKRYRRKIGPDPSSINAAMMGGIISNNSSGMCCGVALNSYHTLCHIRFVLPDGKVFSTENADDYQRIQRECAVLCENIRQLRGRIMANVTLRERIRDKYRTKNTVGYSLNAFLDFDHPLDILAHLMVGAEGTLGFISEAVLRTVPDYPFKSTALLYFSDIYSACSAIVPLKKAGAAMVELMDRASLRAIENLAGMPAVVKTLPEGAAALLIEFQEETLELVRGRVTAFLDSAGDLAMLNQPVFTENPAEQAFFWKVRKGLFPAVGAVRASGTTVILEDVAFPVERLGDAILDLQQLFIKYSYHNAIIFGHAKDGNIHFVVTQSFGSPQEIQRYDSFLREVVELVINRYDGTLKAEHGTGRNMAPFVETEWGGDAYDIIKKIKLAVDPELLLNPGVIVNEDRDVHVSNLKNLPSVEAEVDRCIECGYCEHRCPSRDLTTTPRRRIVIRRVLKDLELSGNTGNYNKLLEEYQYDGIETCAVDGLCATACPVDINTGDLIKRLRRESHDAKMNRYALFVAKNFKTFQTIARASLATGTAAGKLVGHKTLARATRSIKRVISLLPVWSPHLSGPPDLSVLKGNVVCPEGDQQIVYFPSCISRMMGTYPGKQKNVIETFMIVASKAGIRVNILKEVNSLCCGQIFSSKGYQDAYRFVANNIVERLWLETEEGRIPVVNDVSSCAYTLQKLGEVLNPENLARYRKLTIMDTVDFLHDMVILRVSPRKSKRSIVIHPVCSLEKMNTVHKLIAVANCFSGEVTVPRNAGCCGMAGDRGFLYPELTASATASEGAEVSENNFDGYYSSTKTCEIAMSESVQQNYESILYLVDEALA